MNVVDLIFLIAADSLALAFIPLSVRKGAFRRLLCLNLYAACLLGVDAVRLVFLNTYGLRSTEYYLAFYLSDFCLVVLLYMAILSVFDTVLCDSPLRSQARMAFLFFFAIVAAMAAGFSNRPIFVEFQQNLYFASVVLTALLCVTLAHLRVADPRLRMLVYGLGVHGAMQAGNWALRNLMPKDNYPMVWEIGRRMGPLATIALLALWCYALTRVPSLEPTTEEVRSRMPIETGDFELAPAFLKAEARS